MDAEYETLLAILAEAREDVAQAERAKAPSADLLKLRDRAYKAWQEAEEYREKTGCSLIPTP